MSQQYLLQAKAELDAAWYEAIERADVALEKVVEARLSISGEAKAAYLRITEAALFSHGRWCSAAIAAVEAMDRYYEETALFPAPKAD